MAFCLSVLRAAKRKPQKSKVNQFSKQAKKEKRIAPPASGTETVAGREPEWFGVLRGTCLGSPVAAILEQPWCRGQVKEGIFFVARTAMHHRNESCARLRSDSPWPYFRIALARWAPDCAACREPRAPTFANRMQKAP